MSGESLLHAETLDEYLPDGPISSLRRIEVLYGALSKASEEHINEEFSLYYTPGELDEFVADSANDRYLAAAIIDLTGEKAVLEDVQINPLQPSDVQKLGYAWYSSGRGIDHSITRRGSKSGSSVDRIASYLQQCLYRWTNGTGNETAIGELAENHPDGDVIKQIRCLGSKESTSEKLKQHVEAKMPANKSPRVVATVAIRIEPSSLSKPPKCEAKELYFPAELHVLNAAMRERKRQMLSEKNTKGNPSKGEGICLSTGRRSTLYGTPDDPLGFFSLQHSDEFLNLDRTNSWRNHPVAENTALLLQAGRTLLNQCSRTRDGLRIYTLPYVVDCDAEKAGWLYDAIEDADATTIAKVQESAEDKNPEFAEKLRFYVVGVRNDSGDINVLHEVPNVGIYWPRKVASAHFDVLEGSTFGSVAGFRRPEADDWRHIDRGVRNPETVIPAITGGSYARDTLAYSDADDPTTADPREWLISALLTGERVPADRLLSQYVERIASDTDASEGTFPTYLVLTQFAQLEALARADRLHAPDRPELEATPRTTMDETNDPLEPDESLPDPTDLAEDGDVKNYHARKYRLERFLDERDALQDNDERRGAFLFGVFLGQLANHQSFRRDMNRTLREQHPASRMTAERMYRVYPDLEDRSEVYARGEQLFPETERLLKDTFADVPPEDWDLPVEDVRFFYALGLAYGSDAQSQAKQLRKDLGVVDEDDSDDSADE